MRLTPYGKPDQCGTFDLNIMVDHGEDAIGVPLDFEYPHPSPYWVYDAHINENAYKHLLEFSRRFKAMFVNVFIYLRILNTISHRMQGFKNQLYSDGLIAMIQPN